MLDISAVLRTGDRLTPDTPGCIFIGNTPHATSLSAPGPGVSLFGSDREQRRSCCCLSSAAAVCASRRYLQASVRFQKCRARAKPRKRGAIKFKIKREDNVDTNLILSSHFYDALHYVVCSRYNILYGVGMP